MTFANYNQLPYYVRLGIRLLVILLAGAFIYFGQNIIVPLYFSFLLSVLLLPVTNYMEKLKIPRVMANLLAIMIALIFIFIIIYFVYTQISHFARDIPSIKRHIADHYQTFRVWLRQKYNISYEDQSVIISNAAEEVKSSGGQYLGQTFTSITTILFTIVMVSIYSFLILYYRHMIRNFLFAIFEKNHNLKLEEVVIESKAVIKNYMTGLLIEMAIVAAANSLILLILGIKYAIFLGVFAAILNIIPYVGIFTAMVFTVLVTLTTSAHMSDLIWIVISFGVIHFIDSNFLMPRIVGSKVKINALMTIIGVVIGGTLLGLPGIFLALPTIAILKIIFDRVEDMKPWGMLLGDDVTGTPTGRLYGRLKNIRRKPKNKKAVAKAV